MSQNALLPKVAVITVYYNRPDNIEESIQSLISQTYENLDIYIIDDRSKDQTYQNLKQKVTNVNRVILLQNDVNKGFTNSLIDTIANLDVKYVAIHGAGDVSSANRIQEQVAYLEANPEVGVLTTDLLNTQGRKYHKIAITLDDLLEKNRITHGTAMFRLDKYKEAGGYRSFFTARQDADLWFRMSFITKIHFLPVKLYSIVKIQNSVSYNFKKSEIPTLLGAFARFLARERRKLGYDSLDKEGEKAALVFKPSYANGYLYRYFYLNLKSLKFDVCIQYLQNLIKFNDGFLYKLFLKGAVAIMRFFQFIKSVFIKNNRKSVL